VDVVGARAGYRDLSTLRRLFERETGLALRDYQRRFAAEAEPSLASGKQHGSLGRLSDLPRNMAILPLSAEGPAS
jgi:AraC-like DNA-binding protein